MVYLNVTEIESALKGLAATHPDTCQLIELPERTDEGRTCFALRIGSNPGSATKGILFTANAHAREWGGADCAVNFAADVLTKYADGRGIAYGGIDWSANEVKRLVDTMDVFVVPCVNPDGRAYSQGTDTRWRKNRSRRSGSSQVGVDINRNFDILWDSERVFDPEVVSYASMGSSRPAADTYRGPSPHSEPETRNIVSLLDDHPQIGWLFDIHCYSGEVLHSWGGSPNQWTQPEMNFRNQDYDGQRGTHDASVYAEYIPYPDFATQRDLATSVSLTMRNVRGEAYQVHQSFYLVPDKWKRGTYPTGGIVDDYAFSRHLADPTKPKVHGFTLEFGLRPEFQPPVAGDGTHRSRRLRRDDGLLLRGRRGRHAAAAARGPHRHGRRHRDPHRDHRWRPGMGPRQRETGARGPARPVQQGVAAGDRSPAGGPVPRRGARPPPACRETATDHGDRGTRARTDGRGVASPGRCQRGSVTPCSWVEYCSARAMRSSR